MNSARRRAARIALFIECAGQVPVPHGSSYKEYCQTLEQQYLSVEPAIRRLARVEARKRIRDAGGVEQATTHLILDPPAGVAAAISYFYRRQRTTFRRKIRKWPKETPPCPVCRMAWGMPKRSWSTRQMAEDAMKRQNDTQLIAYPCPAQPGYWHLAHRRQSGAIKARQGPIPALRHRIDDEI